VRHLDLGEQDGDVVVGPFGQSSCTSLSGASLVTVSSLSRHRASILTPSSMSRVRLSTSPSV